MTPKIISTGQVVDPGPGKRPRILEAFQAALENAPPPPSGTDIQSHKLLTLEVEFGGFVGSTTTRVSIEVSNGPLPR